MCAGKTLAEQIMTQKTSKINDKQSLNTGDITDDVITAENYRADVISLLLKVAGQINGLASTTRYNLPDGCRDELNGLREEIRATTDGIISTNPQEQS